MRHSWATAEFLDFLPHVDNRLIVTVNYYLLPLPFVAWSGRCCDNCKKFLPLDWPWELLLWSCTHDTCSFKISSEVYQMHLWIGSGLLRFANLLGASDWLHSILGGSLAITWCLPWHRLLELYDDGAFWLFMLLIVLYNSVYYNYKIIAQWLVGLFGVCVGKKVHCGLVVIPLLPICPIRFLSHT